ncbi:unnamed protein product [Calypogeia fissa]
MAVETGSSYEEAVAKLDSLIHRGLNSDPQANGKTTWAAHFEATFKHLQILELDEPLERLSVIHVAGTKGKGSTCAFTESMLRASGFRTGLFTSPHLVDVCERFRLDGRDVSRKVFAANFWWVYNRLQENTDIIPMPGFFRFMTLLALRMFIVEKVDVAILEVGLGGRLDATNVVRAPAVCGIASLGFDHMELLGNTLTEIATEKAGIFKPGVPAITAPQQQEAMEALLRRAEDLKISLTVAPALDSYGLSNLKLGLNGEHQRINAALAIALCRRWAQRSGNEEHWTKALQTGGLPEPYVLGLASTRWPGRAEIIHDHITGEDEKTMGNGTHLKSGKLQFYLDGAHSPESMDACARWFFDTVKAESVTSYVVESNGGHATIVPGERFVGRKVDASFRRVLLFNCMPKRDPKSLLPPLVKLCAQQELPFHMAFFTPNASSYSSISVLRTKFGNGATRPDLSWQLTLQKCWESLRLTMVPESNGCHLNSAGVNELYAGLEEQKGVCHSVGSSSAVMSSLPGALEWIRSCAKRHPQLRIQVLVTGSLYLVGDMLRLLKR